MLFIILVLFSWKQREILHGSSPISLAFKIGLQMLPLSQGVVLHIEQRANTEIDILKRVAWLWYG